MTEKRFKHMLNRLGMQFICYDDMEVLLGTFADKDGVNHIVNKLNELNDENEQLKSEVAYYKLLLMSLEEEAKRISSIRSWKND